MRRFEMPFWHGRIGPHDLPGPGRHNRRFYGAHSNRARVSRSSAVGETAGSAAETGAEKDNADFSREARSTWARLLRNIFEVDPLVCKCGARMRIISFITDPRVVDRILRHRESEHCKTKALSNPALRRAPAPALGSNAQRRRETLRIELHFDPIAIPIPIPTPRALRFAPLCGACQSHAFQAWSITRE